MNEEKIKISINEEDVQNIIDCYEKDIKYIEALEKENQQLKHILDELEKYLEEFDKSLCKTMVRDNSEFYHFQRGELVFLRNTILKIKEL